MDEDAAASGLFRRDEGTPAGRIRRPRRLAPPASPDLRWSPGERSTHRR